ncbi:cullin-4A [Plectosphaerella plurivora]|uniref:Cullin-4A n=1 Tax=Plectosphaerella plurivora TaxID=936078 RepID=A0A9P8VI02_9PEZI|nr:cullin-4A [Plectosphaerella plurivora]
MSSKMKGKQPDTIDLTQQAAFRPGAGAKKLVIKNLRAPTNEGARQQTDQYYERARQDLANALLQAFQGRPLGSPMERLYIGVENICRRGDAPSLYKMVQEMCDAHLRQTVLKMIQDEGGPTPVDMARSVLKQWEYWDLCITLIRSIFSFLDRTYLLRNKSLDSINDLGISQFRKMTASSSADKSQTPLGKTFQGLCDLVAWDRANDKRFDATLFQQLIRMLHIFGQYQKGFEPKFLKESAQYYTEFAEERSASNLKDYILACEKLIKRERSRCDQFQFESTTKRLLLDSAHKILIKDYSAKLLNNDSVFKLLSENESESLQALYELLRLSGIQAELKQPWGDYIKATGASIVGDTTRGDDMVLRLLQLRRTLDLLIRDAFEGDDGFTYFLRQAFSAFMNDTKSAAGWSAGTSKVGEMIAKHVDLLLRGGIKALPAELLSDHKDRTAAEQGGQSGTGDEEAELDRQLDQAVELFRFIEGKDAFETFYKKDLARRLLMGRSASSDAERNMLRKLRDECGNNFTRNLEQMFKDQELAKGEMEAYKSWIGSSARGSGSVDLNVMVISASAWPSYKETRLNIPEEVATEVKRFEGWYNSKHDGRKLNWPHMLAHCSIKAKFPKGTKELLVSAFQAVVLVLFNEVGVEGYLTYEQISTSTGLTGGELERTLQSLACGKSRVLSKHPKGRDVNTTDTFTVNKAFSDPKVRIKINQIQLKETKEENKETHERIELNRRFETQAAIVRIMKSRKTIGHAELVAETISMTRKRGPVDAAQIKKEIETLIDKDYMERDGKMYTYVA